MVGAQLPKIRDHQINEERQHTSALSPRSTIPMVAPLASSNYYAESHNSSYPVYQRSLSLLSIQGVSSRASVDGYNSHQNNPQHLIPNGPKTETSPANGTSAQHPGLALMLLWVRTRNSVLTGSVLNGVYSSTNTSKTNSTDDEVQSRPSGSSLRNNSSTYTSPPLLPHPKFQSSSPSRYSGIPQGQGIVLKEEPSVEDNTQARRENTGDQIPEHPVATVTDLRYMPHLSPAYPPRDHPGIRDGHYLGSVAEESEKRPPLVIDPTKRNVSAPVVPTMSGPGLNANGGGAGPGVVPGGSNFAGYPGQMSRGEMMNGGQCAPGMAFGQNGMAGMAGVLGQFPGQVPMMMPMQSYNMYRGPIGVNGGPGVPYTYGMGMPQVVPAVMARGGEMAACGPMMMHGQAMEAAERAVGEQNNALVNKRRIIKRRTRTGCLTCRKRRIKCDERKPHCYNCERSKKLCLGYEVVPANNSRRRNLENSDKSEKSEKSERRSSVYDLM